MREVLLSMNKDTQDPDSYWETSSTLRAAHPKMKPPLWTTEQKSQMIRSVLMLFLNLKLFHTHVFSSYMNQYIPMLFKPKKKSKA